MKEHSISKKIFNEGSIFQSTNNEKIQDIDHDFIISSFEKKGIIIFRDFLFDPAKVTEITDKFTLTYANDAPRRENLFENKNISTVDLGFHEMPLHSEASYSPSWPEILWFVCLAPSIKGGQTTICDGIKLWENLSAETKNFFLSHPIKFELEFPVLQIKEGRGKRNWMLNVLGSYNGEIDWDKGIFSVNQVRSAVTESRILDKLAFSNHLMIIFSNEPQIKKYYINNGEPIPKEYKKEIKTKSEDLTYEIQWKVGDLAMVDNRRFMHGRRTYDPNQKRKIINIQTLKANFAYGSTTRKK